MKPRSFWYIFGITAQIAGLIVYLYSLVLFLILDVELVQVIHVSLWTGIPFVLLIGFGSAHTMKAVTISVTFHNKKTFLSKLDIGLAEMSYHPEFQSKSFLTYKPPFQARFLFGRISVQLDDNSAILVGPNWYIKKLQKWLH